MAYRDFRLHFSFSPGLAHAALFAFTVKHLLLSRSFSIIIQVWTPNLAHGRDVALGYLVWLLFQLVLQRLATFEQSVLLHAILWR
jgi:hypothetical protein